MVDRKFRMIPKMTVKVTPKMTPKRQRMKLYVLEVNFLNDSMGFNKRLLWKIKIRWYTIPIKVLFLSSFEKQKEYTLALLRNSY